eukprot:11378002-Heterocapsa_arctica.AAC.1
MGVRSLGVHTNGGREVVCCLRLGWQGCWLMTAGRSGACACAVPSCTLLSPPPPPHHDAIH